MTSKWMSIFLKRRRNNLLYASINIYYSHIVTGYYLLKSITSTKLKSQEAQDFL